MVSSIKIRKPEVSEAAAPEGKVLEYFQVRLKCSNGGIGRRA